MYNKVLIALVICAGISWAQSGPSPSAASDPSKTPVTYNPADAPASTYTQAGQLSVDETAPPSAVDLPAAPAAVEPPAMPDAVDIPSGAPSVSQPGVPTNNYGPATPGDAGRLLAPPMVGNGAPTPLSNTYPTTTSGNAPQPPVCDKVCY